MDTLQGLTQLNQVPVDMTLEGLRAIGQRQRTDEITLQELARKQQYEQQADPLRIRQMQLANDVSLQNLGRMTRENKEGDFTSDARMQAELKKHLLSASQADLDQVAQHGQRLAYSMHQDPATRAKERAIGQALLLQSKEAIQEREKIRLQGAQQQELMRMQIDAGRFKKADKGGFTFEQSLSKFKKAHEQHQALVQQALMARREGNEPLAESYEARAESIRPQAEAELRMLQQPGQVDLAATGDIAVTPQGSIAPQNKGPTVKLTPQHEDWVKRAMAANPGATREQIIEQGTKLGKFK